MKFLKRLQRYFKTFGVFTELVNFIINYGPEVHIPADCPIAIVSPQTKVTGNKRSAYIYISLTEINRNSPLFPMISKELISYNRKWDSYLVDITSDNWGRVIEEEIKSIKEKGFRNIFIDTVDNAEILCQKYPLRSRRIKDSGISLIRLVRSNFPGRIIINRGFYLYPYTKDYIDGVLIESLFFKRQGDKWIKRSRFEMDWLKEKIKQLHKDGKVVLAIDYIEDCFEKEKARKIAQQWNVSWKLVHESLQQ